MHESRRVRLASGTLSVLHEPLFRPEGELPDLSGTPWLELAGESLARVVLLDILAGRRPGRERLAEAADRLGRGAPPRERRIVKDGAA